MKPEELKKDNSDKEGQFYSAITNAWFATRLEKDKTLITLSAGGIGLLVTLVTTVGTSNLFVLIAFISAILCFVISTISVLVIFDKNAQYLERLKDNNQINDPSLKRLDKVAFLSFIIGTILALIIGLFAGIEQYAIKKRGKIMAEQKENSSGELLTKRSFNGAWNMSPSSSSSQTGSSQGKNTGGNNSTDVSNSQSSNSTSKK